MEIVSHGDLVEIGAGEVGVIVDQEIIVEEGVSEVEVVVVDLEVPELLVDVIEQEVPKLRVRQIRVAETRILVCKIEHGLQICVESDGGNYCEFFLFSEGKLGCGEWFIPFCYSCW